MATVAAAVLDDIKLRYRHTYTTAQVLVWMNEEQRELYEMLEIDAPSPYTFTTLAGIPFYPLDSDLDVTKIKAVTLQTSDSSTEKPEFKEIDFKRNDDRQYVGGSETYYSILGPNGLFLNVPGGVQGDRIGYIFCDAVAVDIVEGGSIDLPIKYMEILKLGTLERIAAARKDIEMKTNYASDKQEKIESLLWLSKLKEPEWTSPIDVMPKVGGWWN